MASTLQAPVITHHIVVDDPEAVFWEGAIIQAPEVPALRARRVITLPIEADLVRRSAVGGYFRRSWGSGWPISGSTPKLVCPMLLYVSRDDNCRRVHWAARLVPESRQVLEHVRSGQRLVGMLRLTADSGQPGAYPLGLGASPNTPQVEGEKLGQPDAENGWVVYGEGIINAPADGMAGFGLYGAIQGLHVAWAAITQSR